MGVVYRAHEEGSGHIVRAKVEALNQSGQGAGEAVISQANPSVGST
jgi:hypothetical protein